MQKAMVKAMIFFLVLINFGEVCLYASKYSLLTTPRNHILCQEVKDMVGRNGCSGRDEGTNEHSLEWWKQLGPQIPIMNGCSRRDEASSQPIQLLCLPILTQPLLCTDTVHSGVGKLRGSPLNPPCLRLRALHFARA